MTWFKVDDGFYDHPKTHDVSDSAIALWVRAGSWSARSLTDGYVPASMLPRLTSGDVDALAAELCDRRLWRRIRGGFRFHDWQAYNPTKNQVLERREKEVDKKRKARAERGKPRSDPGLSPGDTPRESRVTRPDPESPSSRGDSRGGGHQRERMAPRSPSPPAGHDNGHAHQKAQVRAIAIANCGMCDDHGYQGKHLCDHDPVAIERNRRGVALAKAALAKGGAS